MRHLRRSDFHEDTDLPVTVGPHDLEAAAPPPRPPARPAVEESDDIERGRTLALLAALGRMQLTLDLIGQRLSHVEEQLSRLSEPVR
jgi:hypothetical protein